MKASALSICSFTFGVVFAANELKDSKPTFTKDVASIYSTV